MPFSVELTVSVPWPFNTMSSLAKMTPSMLLSESSEVAKVPVTSSVLVEPDAVVTNTLSADFT